MNCTKWTIILVVCICVSCNNAKNSVKLNSLNVEEIDSFEIHTSTAFDSDIKMYERISMSSIEDGGAITWKPYISNNSQLTFILPSNWEMVPKESSLLFCNFGENKESFFTLLTYHKGEYSITFDSFLEAIMEDMESDTVNHFEINENFRGKSLGYNVNFFSTSMLELGQKSIGYSLITETDSLILDFSMKVMEEDYSEFSKVLFFLSAGSFRINGVPLFEQEESSSGMDFGIK